MSESFDTIVIGAGPAGLATSRELTQAGVEHVVLERGRVGEMWRGLWDSFCLVTPNWTVQLPGHGYDGDDPDGSIRGTRSSRSSNGTRPGSARRCGRASR